MGGSTAIQKGGGYARRSHCKGYVTLRSYPCQYEICEEGFAHAHGLIHTVAYPGFFLGGGQLFRAGSTLIIFNENGTPVPKPRLR